MKKIILFILLSTLTWQQIFAQCGQISMIGEFSSWAEDFFMSPDSSNPGVYHAHIHFSLSDDLDQNGVVELKFRADSSWLVNWGGNGFPEGSLVQDGANIPAAFGDYSVTFNCNTGYYFFLPTCGEISITGLYSEMNDTLYMVQDSNNLNLWVKSVNITADEDPHGIGLVYLVFRESSEWMHYWGGNDFPQGTAVFNGSGLGVPYGNYNVTFNCETFEYDFNSTFGVDEVITANDKIVLSPNPASESLTIFINNPTHVHAGTLAISDFSGRMVMEKTFSLHSGQGLINIDIHHINPGIYLYHLVGISDKTGENKITATGKLIVIR